MKELFGTDLKKYSAGDIAAIHAAVHYEILLYRMYAVWNFLFMFAGTIFVYVNTSWFTTTEMIIYLAMFWAVSGLPFFVLRDAVKFKFAGKLPGDDAAPPSIGFVLLKLVAGLAFGSWATHVMLIAALAKHFELMGYCRKLENA